MDSERTTYEAGNVRVSTARVVFGATTNATANISSVELTIDRVRQLAAYFGAVVLFIGAALTGVAAAHAARSDRLNDYYIAAVVFILAFLLCLVAAKLKCYGVRLQTNAGSTRAYEAGSLEVIQPIVTAIEDAIVARG